MAKKKCMVEASCLTDHHFQAMLLRAIKTAGTLDPEAVLSLIEEDLTIAECKEADDFLKWAVQRNVKFGHGNIDKTVAAFLRERRKGVSDGS